MAGWTVCMLLLLCTYQATAATANLAAQPSNAQQYGAAADSINISIESAANPADDDPNQKTVPSLALRHMSRRQRLISSPVPAPPATPTAVRNSSRTRQGTFKPRGGPARPGRRRGYLPSARSTAAAVVASAAQYAGSAVPRVPLELIRGMARPALNPDTVMFAAVYQQQGEGDAAAHAAAAASSDLSTASICSGDPALKPTVNSRTTCRLFVNTGDWLVPCTAWFVSQTHMVTAGHCVAQQGRYIFDLSSPGFVCCGFDSNGDCLPERTFSIVRWVTTDGFWEDAATANDGAVIKVLPWNTWPRSIAPEPQQIKSFHPNIIPDHVVYMDGFPARVESDAGCSDINMTVRYETIAKITPLSALAGVDGLPVQFAVSGCQGESGGRVLAGGSNGVAYGIQTHGSTVCMGNRGMTGVTQITETPEINGVCVQCLMAAIP